MKKRYFLSLANVILLITVTRFVIFRFSKLKQLYIEIGEELSLMSAVKMMKIEVIILLLAVLSLIGVLLFVKNKLFFFISAFFISTQIVTLLFAPSWSVVYLIRFLAVIAFVWFLIGENTFAVYKDKLRMRIVILISAVIIYIVILYSLGIIGNNLVGSN